jgi:hypothetical protein
MYGTHPPVDAPVEAWKEIGPAESRHEREHGLTVTGHGP